MKDKGKRVSGFTEMRQAFYFYAHRFEAILDGQTSPDIRHMLALDFRLYNIFFYQGNILGLACIQVSKGLNRQYLVFCKFE